MTLGDGRPHPILKRKSPVYQRALRTKESRTRPGRPILIPRGGPRPWGSYQLNAGNRCAKRRSRRSRSTVEGEVMCSHRVQSSSYMLSRRDWTSQPCPDHRCIPPYRCPLHRNLPAHAHATCSFQQSWWHAALPLIRITSKLHLRLAQQASSIAW